MKPTADTITGSILLTDPVAQTERSTTALRWVDVGLGTLTLQQAFQITTYGSISHNPAKIEIEWRDVPVERLISAPARTKLIKGNQNARR